MFCLGQTSPSVVVFEIVSHSVAWAGPHLIAIPPASAYHQQGYTYESLGLMDTSIVKVGKYTLVTFQFYLEAVYVIAVPLHQPYLLEALQSILHLIVEDENLFCVLPTGQVNRNDLRTRH